MSLFWLALLAVVRCTVVADDSNLNVVPDPGTEWGHWDGWGVSLCWWANVFGDRDDLADVVFTNKTVTIAGVELPGLDFNIARYNAGASAWKRAFGESMKVSPNIPHWKQIHGFWEDWGSEDPTSNSWNWSDTKQVAMLQKAHSRGANRLELFSNSPMWWMLKNHNPSGTASGLGDNLESWNYRNHTVYLATVAAHAQTHWGIEFESVDPFNEPMGTWWTAKGTQEGCRFERSTQSTVIQYMREELDRHGVKSIVSASDENTYDAALQTWNSFSEETKKVVGRVNVHGYQQGEGRRDLLYSAVVKKPLWNSEYGDGDGSGVSLVTNLNLDFKWLHPSAYCYWQVLDESDGWGLFRFNSETFVVDGPNVKYWALAHYSRHIRPGMLIIGGGEDNTVAAYDNTRKVLVLVSTNFEPSREISFDLSKFASASGPVTRWSTDMGHKGKRYEKTSLQLSGKKLAAQFSKNIISTFEVENVELHSKAVASDTIIQI